MGGMKWWTMPGPQRFVSSVLAHLHDGRSVIVVFPALHPRGFLGALEAADEHSGMSRWTRRQLAVEDEEYRELLPARVVHDLVVPQSEPGAVASVHSLIAADNFRYLLLTAEFREQQVWCRWSRFLHEYSQRSKALDQSERPVFCVVIEGALLRAMPPSDVTLAIEQWRGVVRPLDMQLYVSHLIDEEPSPPPLLRSTRIAVTASLAGTDPLLARRLVNASLDMLFNPNKLLGEYSDELRWNNESDIERQWELGMRDEIDGSEYVHSALLPLARDGREIARRVWYGQVSQIVPYLELQRCRLIDGVQHLLPKPPLHDGYEDVSDLHDLEIRTVWYYLKRARAPREIIERAARLRNIRNALAHLQPISAANLESLSRARFG